VVPFARGTSQNDGGDGPPGFKKALLLKEAVKKIRERSRGCDERHRAPAPSGKGPSSRKAKKMRQSILGGTWAGMREGAKVVHERHWILVSGMIFRIKIALSKGQEKTEKKERRVFGCGRPHGRVGRILEGVWGGPHVGRTVSGVGRVVNCSNRIIAAICRTLWTSFGKGSCEGTEGNSLESEWAQPCQGERIDRAYE